MDLFCNISIWSAFIAWMAAQSIKMFTTWCQTRRVDFHCLVSTGGMPSAHSAMASALAVSIGLRDGFASSVFAVTACFAAIVMFDAQSVRRAAGQQARLLNQMVDELFREHHLSQTKLAELLGHTRLEVGLGLCLGVVVALLLHHFSG